MEPDFSSKENLLSLGINFYRKKQYSEALYCYREWMKRYEPLKSSIQYNIKSCVRLIKKKYEGLEIQVNNFFDHVYVINLPSSTKRKNWINYHFKKKRIDFSFISAVDGREILKDWDNKFPVTPLPLEIHDSLKSNTKISIAPGELGYLFSYEKVILDAISKNFKKILVFDDDVLLHYGFTKWRLFSRLFSFIPTDWKVVMLGASQYKWNDVGTVKDLLNGYYTPKPENTYGSFAMCYQSDVYDSILDSIKKIREPFDHGPLWKLFNKFKGSCYVCYPNIVIPNVGNSYIRESRNQYEHSIKMRWDLPFFPWQESNTFLN